jgi:spore germination protein YaaH
MTAARRLLIAAAAAGAILPAAGFTGIAHASVCSHHAVRSLSWTRAAGAKAGVLHWKAPAIVPDEVGYRVWRSGALVGVARRRHAAVRVTPRQTYRFTVRVENLVTGHVSICPASITRTIVYHAPGKARGLVASSVTASSVHLAWRAAARGDGRPAGYRVYRNGEVVRQVENTHVTVRNLFSDTEYRFVVRAVDTNGVQGRPSRTVGVTTRTPPRTTGDASAFVLASDGGSFADLQRHYMHVGTIFPTYFNCTPGGGVTGVDDPLVTTWSRERGISVEPRFNCQSPSGLRAILTNQTVQAAAISALVNLTTAHGYQGINVDFESNDASQYRTNMTTFITRFASALHAQGKRLSVEVSAASYNQLTGRAGFYDYRGLSAVADQVVVMAWGKYWATSGPGGLDPMPWFDAILSYVATMPKPAKFTIAMTMYGIDWPSGGGPAHPGTPLEWTLVQELIAKYGARPVLDPATDDRHFAYTDAAGIHHDVWYSNRRTVGDRILHARRLHLGIAFWRLGREDPDIWTRSGIG